MAFEGRHGFPLDDIHPVVVEDADNFVLAPAAQFVEGVPGDVPLSALLTVIIAVRFIVHAAHIAQELAGLRVFRVPERPMMDSVRDAPPAVLVVRYWRNWPKSCKKAVRVTFRLRPVARMLLNLGTFSAPVSSASVTISSPAPYSSQ